MSVISPENVTMKIFLAAVCVALLGPGMASGAESKMLVVHYGLLSEQPSPEDSAAISWLNADPSLSPRLLHLNSARQTMRNVDVIWVHLPDSTAYQRLMSQPNAIGWLRQASAAGAKMLFTDYAAFLPYDLGLEHKRPAVRLDTIQNDWLFDKRGFQSFRGHPLFKGLFGGEYVWDPNVDQILPSVGYFGKNEPQDGAVIGVDKEYVFIHADRKLIIERTHGHGKTVSIGSAIFFARENNLRRNLEALIKNALRYLAGLNIGKPVTYWHAFENIPRQFSVASRPIHPSKERTLGSLPTSELLLMKSDPKADFYDVAGRRALIMGKECGGIDEVWTHPFRALRDYEAGIVTPDSVAWLKNLPLRIEVRPESFTRVYTIPGGTLKEVVYASLVRAGGIVHYEANIPIRLLIRFRSDLRWMWPYDANALGDLHYAFDTGMNALHVKDTTGSFYCLMGADAPPQSHLSGQYASIEMSSEGLHGIPTALNQVYHAAVYDLAANNVRVLNFAFVGTNEGYARALPDYRALLENPAGALVELVRHYQHLLSRTVAITSPDVEFNQLFKWAIVGTDRFVARTPGVGTGLLAGFGTTARGWDGSQKISGRPGYAWYFGRDSEWSGFAIDDYGDCETLRQQLNLLQSYQDRYGKIFHEISTSGSVHFDASDATPLYIMLAGHYLRASGDLTFIKKSWPFLKSAMDFLYSTDTDGDGLIEDTNVGHGWLEPGGRLFGSHSEFYLSALWAQCLADMASIAERIGKKDLAAKYSADARRVKRIVNDDFWNDSTGFYNYGKNKDGSYGTEPTALPTVAAYLNLLDDERVASMLRAYAGNGFTTDWGVRLLSSQSPWFDPRGYHEGSIWPLFTGWTALAEYEYGNSTQGFSHIMNNLYIKNHWALGFVEEVIHGTVYRPGGVCPHQCWSETNILHPAITGMVGWKPDALEHAATLQPRFPYHWDGVTVTNLRAGNSLLELRMKRSPRKTIYTLVLHQGPAVRVTFAPELPVGSAIKKVTIGGAVVPKASLGARGLLHLPLPVAVSKEMEVVIEHRGGFGLDPVIPRPSPGDSSGVLRIVSISAGPQGYTATVEGKPRTETFLRMHLFDQAIEYVEGGDATRADKEGEWDLHLKFKASPAPFVSQDIVVKTESTGR
jgi:glycogen debranching enzyme